MVGQGSLGRIHHVFFYVFFQVVCTLSSLKDFTVWSSRVGESPPFPFNSVTFLFNSLSKRVLNALAFQFKKREEQGKKIEGGKKPYLNKTAISYNTALLEQ